MKPPSLALTDLKPKDCKLFKDTKQRLYFRFHIFFAQAPDRLSVWEIRPAVSKPRRAVTSKQAFAPLLRLCALCFDHTLHPRLRITFVVFAFI